MTGNNALLITLLAASTACVGYAAGRLHQWYRTVLDRDEAYRDGYDTATRSVFSLAARLISPKRAVRGTAAVTPAAGSASPSVTPPPAGLRPSALRSPGSSSSPSPPSSSSSSSSTSPSESSADGASGGRHLVPDELVQAPTYRLTPDRVARAKVRETVPEDDESEETTRLPSVPRPRTS